MKIKSAIHTYVVVELAKRGLSQTEAATICRISPQNFNMIIRGTKVSAPAQLKIANLFGFRSWSNLCRAAEIFQLKEVNPYKLKENA